MKFRMKVTSGYLSCEWLIVTSTAVFVNLYVLKGMRTYRTWLGDDAGNYEGKVAIRNSRGQGSFDLS